MQVSYRWLSSLVDLSSLTPHAVADALIRAGIEVEDVTPFAQASQLTTGKVVSKKPVEGSDHLNHVMVDTAQHGIRSIVCGAPNIDVNQVVIVALPGAQLVGGTIQASTIRGVASEGMVCALNELGIPSKFLRKDQVEGIEVLPASTPLGDDAILDHLGFDDTILHVKLLANRPDLLSLENLAKEVAAVCQVKLLPQSLAPYQGPRQPASIAVHVHDDRIAQFSLQTLRGVQPVETPTWMKSRLMVSGVRPISFFVDIGNYIMLLTGQPLHMYDLDKLPQPQLDVGSQPASTFVALDEKTYDLLPDDLHISSSGQVMCLAGVMGSLACAVDDTTRYVGIEAAEFHPASIRKTALRLNLISESSQRFAKGIDLSQSQRVIAFTEALIASLTTIETYETCVTIDRAQRENVRIPFEPQRINALLGTTFSSEAMKDVFHRLGMTVESDVIIPPVHRKDVQHSADLAEEVIRLLGFDSIQNEPMVQPVQAGGYNDIQLKRKRIKESLRARGFQECLTYTLVPEAGEIGFTFASKKAAYRIKNPLSDERQLVRTSGLKSLLDTAIYNVSRQALEGQLFEWSLISSPDGDEEHLNVVWYGTKLEQSLLQAKPVEFYDIKGVAELILGLLYLEPSRLQWEPLREHPDVYHPGRSARLLLQGQVAGYLGELSPFTHAQLGFGKFPVVMMTLNMSMLMATKTSSLRLNELAKFPFVTRDLAFIIRQDIPFQNVVKAIKKAGKSLVQSVDVFDLYQGEHIPSGYQSMAIRVKLLDRQKTLLDRDIQTTMDEIKTELMNSFRVDFRG